MPGEGWCYLCGRWSKQLRYVCVAHRDDMLLVYLCPDCHIYKTKEVIYAQLCAQEDGDMVSRH